MAGSLSRKTLVIAVGTGIQSILTQVAVNLVLVRIFATQEQFGVYRQVWLVVNTALPLFTFGIDLSLYHFWAKIPLEARRSFLLRSLGVLGVSSLLLSVSLYLAADAIARAFSVPDAGSLFRAICPYVLIGLPASLLYSFLIADGQASRAIATNLVILLLQAGLTVAMVARGYSLETLFHCLGVFVALRALYAISEIVRFTRSSGRRRPDVGLRAQLSWAIPSGITTQIGVVGSRLDKFVVAGFMDAKTYALYSVGALEFPLIGLLWSAASTVLRIRVSSLHHAGDAAGVYGFYLNVLRKLSLALIPSAVVLGLFAPELMSLLYTSEYVGAAGVFRIYLFMTAFRLAPLDAILASLGRTRTVLAGGILFLGLDLLLCLVLVRWNGLQGPPWATVIATGLVALYYGIMTARALGVPLHALLRIRGFWRIVFSAGTAALAAYPIKLVGWPSGAILLVGGLVYALIYLGIARATRAVTREDLDILREFLSRIRGRLGA